MVETSEYIHALANKLNISQRANYPIGTFNNAGEVANTYPEICYVQRGGNSPGTWFHQKLALKFAGWLNPKFELWVYDRIEELLKNGYTKLDTISRKELALMLLQAEDERERLEMQNQLQAKELNEAAPKVEYYNDVLQSRALIPANVIAKELGMSAVSLNKLLHQLGVIYRSGDTWVLYHKYQHKGYTGTKTVTYTDSRGNRQSAVHTYWTEHGREFVHNLISEFLKNNKAA